jgi:hypothetical protein
MTICKVGKIKDKVHQIPRNHKFIDSKTIIFSQKIDLKPIIIYKYHKKIAKFQINNKVIY